MRTINKIHRAVPAPIQDLITFRALPTQSVDYIDPFLFLNHHGPQVYRPGNSGLPFGPHPHRGMETVTFIIDGDIAHKDSGGHNSVIRAGGIQWMTAGKGLIHEEVSSEAFMQKGGQLEILQLWLNLPARHKMTSPFYQGLQKEEIPVLKIADGKGTLQMISGEMNGQKGAVQPLTDIFLSTIYLEGGAHWVTDVPEERNIFLYVVRGNVLVNQQEATMHDLVEFDQKNTRLSISASGNAILIFGHATPLNEPMVSHGPFVMNTNEEIMQAYQDYENGLFNATTL